MTECPLTVGVVLVVPLQMVEVALVVHRPMAEAALAAPLLMELVARGNLLLRRSP